MIILFSDKGENSMKKNIITILLVFIIPIFAYFMLNNINGSDAGSVNAQTSKPQVIKFTSAMCLDCQTMNKIMKEIFPKYQGKIALTEIHVQDNKPETQEWINKYKVNLVPTIIMIDSNGNQVKRIEGAIPQDEMDRYLKDLK